MRPIFVALVALACALAFGAHFAAWTADAAPTAPSTPSAFVALQQDPAVDDNDDTRVEVQLVVAGLAVFLVVVVGTAAYLVRWRAGLTAYDPEKAAAEQQGHH